MSPTGRALLASALTLPLMAFVAGALAAPDPVDPDRSRPVIIGRVSDDAPGDKPTRAPDDTRQGAGDDGDDVDDRDDTDDRDDDGEPGQESVDPPGTVVTPQPRNVDGDDDGRDDDQDHDGDDDTDDGGESGDD
jgi:hypothetical protein